MNKLLSILIMALAWNACGQPAPINRRAMVISGLASASIPGPTNISTRMFRWWVSSDVTANVTVSNQWVDRIIQRHMDQMNTTLSPTNGPQGVRFTGTQSLTNLSTGYDIGNVNGQVGEADTFFWIFTPDGTAGEEQIFTDVALGNRGPGMSGTSLRYCGNISGGPNTICTLTAASTNDIVMILTPTNTIWYTNGVVVKTNTSSSVDDFQFGRIGIGGLGNYKGSLLETGIYTNLYYTAANATALHLYATNLYHYSP